MKIPFQVMNKIHIDELKIRLYKHLRNRSKRPKGERTIKRLQRQIDFHKTIIPQCEDMWINIDQQTLNKRIERIFKYEEIAGLRK
jgi:hypothetical protein